RLDNVGGNERLLAVRQDTGQTSLVCVLGEQCVDLVNRRGSPGLDGEIYDRAGRDRSANRKAVQLAGELGDYEADRLGSPCGGWNQVQSRCPSAPEILVRKVDEPLVGRVSVNGRHQPVTDADVLVEDSCDRSETVRGARRIGEDVMRLRLVDLFEVPSENDR